MKSLVIFAFTVAAVISGATSLECYYCYGRDCDTDDPSTLQVETCSTGRRFNYQGEVELSTTEDDDEVSSTTAASEIDEATEGDAETTSSSRTVSARAADETTTEEASNSTTTSTSTTKKPCTRRRRPSWYSKRSLYSKPMCISTRKGLFGPNYRGCYYSRRYNSCQNLLRRGLASTCRSCTRDRCN